MARVILRDGRVAELRAATNDTQDIEIIHELFQRASADSLYFRFFHVVREVSAKSISEMVADSGPNGLSLLCMAGNQALGIGSYARVDKECAEVSFLVEDRVHGRGLGTLLLEHLAQAAWRYGFKQFEAYVLNENYKMLQVFQASGYEIMRERESDRVHLRLPLAETERSRALQETREKLATASSLLPFFCPQTVAVVGASRTANSLGQLLLRHILDGGFQGTVYPVNPNAHAIAAVRAYPNLSSLPERVDLAVIVVPASEVSSVVDDCIEAKARAVMIVTSGLGESGPEGLAIEQSVVRRLRASGCRLIGPNCLGLVNAAGDTQLNASLAPLLPRSGKMAIASQSGALGIAILEYASRIGVGVSSFASTGNKADVSGNDLLLYWEDDPDTQLIVLYLESFGNPRKFSRITRRITKQKPILAVKSARTPAAIAISHARGTLQESGDRAVDALFRQAGIIRVDTLQELFDIAALLTFAPIQSGNRIAIVTNTAGGAVMTVDALLREGLQFIGPPLDLGSETLAAGFREVLPHVLRDEEIDGVIVLFMPVGISDEDAVAQAIAEAIAEVANDPAAEVPRRRKPVVASFLTTSEYVIRHIDAGLQKVPIYPFPEQAVHALAKVIGYARYLEQPQGRIPDLDGLNWEAARILARQAASTAATSDLTAGPATASPVAGGLARSIAILKSIGITSIGGTHTGTPVRLSASGIGCAAIAIDPDPLFGPLVKLSLLNTSHFESQIGASTILDSIVRITPLTDLDAQVMARILYKNAHARLDVDETAASIADLLLRLSRLVEEVPEITYVHLNKIDLYPSGYFVVESDVEVGTVEAEA